MRLIHITDPHLTSLAGRLPSLTEPKRWLSWLSWQLRRRARHRRRRLDALVSQLRARDPDAWAVTGDLCQIGLPGEIAEAADWLQSLDAPARMLLVPGNHDAFAANSLPEFQRRWADALHVDPNAPQWPVTLEFGDVVLIGINSAVVTPIASARGRVGAPALARLAECLEHHRGACRIVAIHHPPQAAACKPRKALIDASELTETLENHGAAMVLHGHLHRNREAELAGGTCAIPAICTASASAAGRQGAAAARAFDVERDGGRFRIRMRLLLLDAGHRLHAVEERCWTTPG